MANKCFIVLKRKTIDWTFCLGAKHNDTIVLTTAKLQLGPTYI